MSRRNSRRTAGHTGHAQQKEKISIIAASVFVLSALTLAGVYMSSQGDVENEENRIDFAKLEQQDNTAEEDGAQLSDTRFVSGTAKTGTTETQARTGSSRYVDSDLYDLSDNNDMDVDPAFTEAASAQVENTKQDDTLSGTDKAAVFMDGQEQQEENLVAEAPLSFSGEALALPIVGDVLMDYSMDKAVYHGTMQQYRYNPALVIAATEGELVTAAVDGIVTDVHYDAQTGNTITFDIGSGYELTYGQLTDIGLEAGDRVAAGDVVGKVAAPTIYYTEEGPNIYYKLTKDGEPVDPLNRQQAEE